MNWMDEQIRERKQNDEDMLSASFAQIAGAVIGHAASSFFDENEVAKDAINAILKFYHCKQIEIPENISSFEDQMEYALRPYGIMHRDVKLIGPWEKAAVGAMLAIRKDNSSVVALLPTGFSGYKFLDYETGTYVKVSKKNRDLFAEDATCFYRPFPLREIGIKDIFAYMFQTISIADICMLAIASFAVTLVGMLGPKLNYILFGQVISSGKLQVLLAAGIFLICASLSTLIVEAIRTLILSRIEIKLNISIEAATMMRVLSLPASFFKDYSAGELNNYIEYMNSLCGILLNTVLSTGLTSLFSLIYIGQVFRYAPALVIPAIGVIVVTLLFSLISSLVQMKITERKMELSSKEIGMSYSLISGIQKIKLAGAEKRAFAKWGNMYSQVAELEYNPPMFIKINPVITTAISLIGTIVMYYASVKAGVSIAEYYAFDTAYGMMFGAFSAIVSIALSIADIKPTLKMARPIMDACPELSENSHVVTNISGNIELSHVSFKYKEGMPNVLDNLSLKIRAGQYVAIVGKTGCGKSTLMRLLLGFEKPQKGAIYYDGRDLETIDKKSLRSKIGTVIQNGKLFQGDIYSNIVISAPHLTVDDAWEAARLAGIDKDIEEMPMGMNTLISEGEGGISGGQKQRLMIARAIAPKPKILMFDEATSALDNITQKQVSDALDNLKCTRIVIAHRLSTIRQCDRIIVLDGGHIIEDGTYDELISQNGFFAELVKRQRVDV